MTIIDKIAPPAPKFIYVPPPTVFKTSLEEERYFQNEKKKWIQGYGGLTGRHYYHLTQTFLKTGEGKVIRPVYRQDDEFIFEFLTRICDNNIDGLWTAGRSIGKSAVLATLYSYNVRLFPGCIQAMTSADLDRIGKFFNQKLDMCISGLHQSISGRRNKFQNSKDGYERGYEVPSLGPDGQPMFAQSDIYGRETSQKETSPTNLSSLRCKFIGIDEAALHKRIKPTFDTSKEVVRDAGKKVGNILLTGTIEENATQESVQQLNEIYRNQHNMSIEFFFTPFYYSRDVRPDGTSDHEAAIREWEEECERLDKMEDKTSLLVYKKNNPRTVEDALSLSMRGTLPSEVLAQVETQKVYLANNPPQIKTCILKNAGDGEVRAELNDKGRVRILDFPERGEEYIAGTDPIQGENAASEEGSQLVTIIYKKSTRKPVALYAERTPYSDILARNVILLCDMYKCKNMIENNQGHVLIGKIKDAGRKDLLMGQPRKNGLYVKAAKGNSVYGVKVTGSERAKDIVYEYIVEYFLNNTDNIMFPEILDDVPNYIIANSDYMDAMQCVLIHEKEVTGKRRSDIEKEEYVEVPVWVPGPGGNKYITIKIPKA